VLVADDERACVEARSGHRSSIGVMLKPRSRKASASGGGGVGKLLAALAMHFLVIGDVQVVSCQLLDALLAAFEIHDREDDELSILRRPEADVGAHVEMGNVALAASIFANFLDVRHPHTHSLYKFAHVRCFVENSLFVEHNV
jgi:hypothetical protein